VLRQPLERWSLAALAGCLFASQAWAFGGTQESWLGGTQPWDSVPFFEGNVGLHATGGDGHPGLGPLLEVGLLDQVMLAGAWDQPVDGSPGAGSALLKIREADFPRWRPAVAAYVKTGLGAATVEARPGLVLAIEPWDQSLVANLETGARGFGFRAGYWTPYLVSFLRAGFEAVLPSSDAAWTLVPQVTLQAPGDVSAVLGAQTRSDGQGQWSWALRISYELFPSP
jgi:hypothetical protein